MDNQHKLIKGYRDLSQVEIDLMNECKSLAEQCGSLIETLEKAEFACIDYQHPDQEWLKDGKLSLQKGFMSVIRSIAKPTTF